jgi:hypothetical protein
MMIQTQKLEYQDHREEIVTLNRILADIQTCQPFPPELQPTVERIIVRLDHLMTVKDAVLKAFP